jgi:spore coat polysaccharide biosynthesis protein SpsF (cytidylyltransferase family)
VRRVIVVQARTGSTRLPGKVLMDVGGRPMIEQQLKRLQRCRRADDIVVATTQKEDDTPVVAIAETVGARWFRGSEDDVLARYLGAASEARADVIVRITADCPLIDPDVTDRVIAELERPDEACDYASNVMPRTFPRGLDSEALSRDALERVGRLASTRPEREHVTLCVRERCRDLFLTRSVVDAEDNSDCRWTVDTADDMTLVRRLYADLELGARAVPYREILAHVRAHPELARINSRVGEPAH